MFLYRFLALAFLTEPSPEECKLEYKHMGKCCNKYDVDYPHWEQKDFPTIAAANMTNLMGCFGPLTCKYNKLASKLGRTRIELAIFGHEHLIHCFGNRTINEFERDCHRNSEEEMECDYRRMSNCFIDKMSHHEKCNSKDIEAFQSTHNMTMQTCVLLREMDDLRVPIDNS